MVTTNMLNESYHREHYQSTVTVGTGHTVTTRHTGSPRPSVIHTIIVTCCRYSVVGHAQWANHYAAVVGGWEGGNAVQRGGGAVVAGGWRQVGSVRVGPEQ